MKLRCYSHAQLNTGYGHAARELALALEGAGVELDIRTLGRPDPTRHPGGISRVIDNPDAVIVHTLPGDCHRVLELEGLQRGAGPKLVAYTTWEAITAPWSVVQPLFDNFDQVWVPSQPTAQALAHGADHGDGAVRQAVEHRTYVIPHCYNENLQRRADHGDHDRFRFYWVGAWTARKNPGGLIRAFALAFPPGSRAELVIHSPGCSMDAFTMALAATGLKQGELPSITLSNQHLSDESLAKLHAEADCFATAARGEAWNLPAFDALLAGRHVISQYGLGSDEFLVDTSADLIDGWEAPAQVDVSFSRADDGSITMKTAGAQGLTSRSLWLEPNLSSLADAMQSAFVNQKRTIEIEYDVAARFGYAAVANLVLNVLEES